MNNYIVELFDCLKKVKFDDITDIFDYDSGIQRLVSEFLICRQNKNTAFFIGNGGSAAIASHMTADFLKNGGLQTFNLYSSAVVTCLSNDFGYEEVFAEQLRRLAKNGDILTAVSSSGNSSNIVNAIKSAKEIGCRIVTFTGFSCDNKVRSLGNINVYVPSFKYGIVESIHNIILQQIVDTIKCMGATGVEKG